MANLISEKTAAASYATNGGTVVFGVFTAQELGIYVGMALGVLTFAMTLYFNKKKERREAEDQKRKAEYQARKDKREQELHEKLMSQESFDTATITELGDIE